MFIKLLLIFVALVGFGDPLKNILLNGSISNTIEVSIPDYENAHNPSIVPYKDGYLLSFRYLFRFPEWSKDFRLLSTGSFVGLVELDRQFQIKKKSIQLLEIQSFSDDFSLYAEDARLFLFQNRIFVLFNDFPAPSPEYIRRHYLVEIVNVNGRWTPIKKALPLVFENMNRIEKNWVPFCSAESLYLIYGEDPHIVLECDLTTGVCRKIGESFANPGWPYGIIRGGTPAIQIDDTFLTFFHSSLDVSEFHERKIYFMGAYAFDASFPFTIRSITPHPIGTKNFYKNTSSKSHPSKKVVFPGGIVRDGNRLHIAWGKDDRRVMITTFELDKLLNSMEPILP